MLERLTPISGITLDADLPHLGIHSLLTARFFAQIHSKFGKKLPLATMVQARTLQKLAAIIRDDHWSPPWSSLIALKKSGSRPPFFIVHAIGGNIVGYDDLAQGLPANQPVYGLQARGLDGESPAATSVEEMAAHYIRGLQTVQPVGPYFLGGWSAGGRVAFEMACQLSESDNEVPLLAIFDTTMAPISMAKRTNYITLLKNIRRSVSWNWRQLGNVGFSRFVGKKRANLRRRTRVILFELLENVKRGLHFGRPAHLRVEEAFTRAIENYRPRIFKGDAVVFRTPDARYYGSDPYLGWRGAVAGELSFRDVPGNHDDIFRAPNLETVVRELTHALDNAHSKLCRSGALQAPLTRDD
jgi:thioesterase domain-containing protein